MTPKILAIEKRPFRQRLAFPVLWVFGPWAACTLTYNNAWRFLDPSIHRPLAVFCAVVMGILIVFGAALIYPVTFFRGASWRERAIACLIIPFLWTVKELHMMPNCYSLAEKLFYALSPIFLGVFFLAVFQMGIVEIVCRLTAKIKHGTYTGQVFGAAPIATVMVGMIALYVFNIWGDRVGFFYVHQEIYQYLFIR
jgi:hypothetical protein